MAADKRAARLGVLALVGMLLFGLVGARLWFLQTVEQESLQAEVNQTKLRTVPLLPERGRIFDAEGRILADNDRVLTVGVDWEIIRSKTYRTEIFRRLSGWVDVPIEEMEARYESGIYSPFLPMPVAEDIKEPTAIAIQERIEDLPGVLDPRTVAPGVSLRPPRQPRGRVHGPHHRGDRRTYYQGLGYFLNERVGQFGIELSMEDELHGTWGSVTYEVDNANRIVREVERVPPINGNDVQLTIDLDQQQFAEQALQTQLALRQQVDAPRTRWTPRRTSRSGCSRSIPRQVPYKAPAGSVVVENYQNGQIIALASYPTFDNRWFEADLGDGKFEQVFPSVDANGEPIDPDESILVNRAIQGRYNLGSTFKPFTAFAALDTGLLTTNDYYRDEGSYRMESVEEDRCNSGLVDACTETPPAAAPDVRACTAPSTSKRRSPSRPTRSSTASARLIMTTNDYQPVLQEEVRKFGFGSDPGIELAVRVRRHRPRRRAQGRVRRARRHQRGRGLGLLHRRQRPARHRTGSAVGVAAAARGRILRHRQPGFRHEARDHQGRLAAGRAGFGRRRATPICRRRSWPSRPTCRARWCVRSRCRRRRGRRSTTACTG